MHDLLLDPLSNHVSQLPCRSHHPPVREFILPLPLPLPTSPSISLHRSPSIDRASINRTTNSSSIPPILNLTPLSTTLKSNSLTPLPSTTTSPTDYDQLESQHLRPSASISAILLTSPSQHPILPPSLPHSDPSIDPSLLFDPTHLDYPPIVRLSSCFDHPKFFDHPTPKSLDPSPRSPILSALTDPPIDSPLDPSPSLVDIHAAGAGGGAATVLAAAAAAAAAAGIKPSTAQDDEPEVSQPTGCRANSFDHDPVPIPRSYDPDRFRSCHRIHWTKQEEELLLNEVELHWERYDCMAQIIKRHGPKGTISRAFADRTGVSLKDKAVNISSKWYRDNTPISESRRRAFARFRPKQLRGKPRNQLPGMVDSVDLLSVEPSRSAGNNKL